jgi:hypothetical protein
MLTMCLKDIGALQQRCCAKNEFIWGEKINFVHLLLVYKQVWCFSFLFVFSLYLQIILWICSQHMSFSKGHWNTNWIHISRVVFIMYLWIDGMSCFGNQTWFGYWYIMWIIVYTNHLKLDKLQVAILTW